MAHTFTKLDLLVNQPQAVGSMKTVVGRLDVTSYVTGGIDLSAGVGGLGKVVLVEPIDGITQNGAAAHFPRVSSANPALLQLYTSAGVQVAGAADGGDLLVRCIGL